MLPWGEDYAWSELQGRGREEGASRGGEGGQRTGRAGGTEAEL